MLKVDFKKIKNPPDTKIEFYDSINRIPLSITIGYYPSLPNTIYCENSSGQNFIEFRFDKGCYNLYEVSLVAIQNDTVINPSLSTTEKAEDFYVCSLIENESLFKDTVPMEIERGESSVCINLHTEKLSKVMYFPISGNCAIGVDENSYLVSILLHQLSEENVKDIFGF